MYATKMLRNVRLAIFHRCIFASDWILFKWRGNLAGREQHCPPPPLLPGQDSMLNTVIMSTQLPCTRDPWHCPGSIFGKGGLADRNCRARNWQQRRKENGRSNLTMWPGHGLALVDRPKVAKSWRSIIGSRTGWRYRHWQTVSSAQAGKQCPPKTLADTVIFSS
jgi:hypothetical protein